MKLKVDVKFDFSKIKKIFQDINSQSLKVGLLQEYGADQEITDSEANRHITIAQLGYENEFGASIPVYVKGTETGYKPNGELSRIIQVPERSWLRFPIYHFFKYIIPNDYGAYLVDMALQNKTQEIYKNLGKFLASNLKQNIIMSGGYLGTKKFKANSKYTKKIKKYNYPLIGTRGKPDFLKTFILKYINYKVVENKEFYKPF